MGVKSANFIHVSAQTLVFIPLLVYPIKHIDFWFYLLFIYDKVLLLSPLLFLSAIYTSSIAWQSLQKGQLSGFRHWIQVFKLAVFCLSILYYSALIVLLFQLKAKI